MRARGLVFVLIATSTCGGCAADGVAAEDLILHTEAGPFEGTLVVEPNPPHVGEHRVVLTLDSADPDAEMLTPVEDASVVVMPFMPAHGHGSTDVEALEDGEAAGLYTAEHVRLTMPGVWELRIHVVQGDAEGDLVATVEVP